jgi:hypothetical protein
MLNIKFLERTYTLVVSVFNSPLPRLFDFLVSNLTLGRLTSLIVYITIAACILTAVDAPILSRHFVEDTAFRAAWLTLTQIPIVYLFSTKRGPINILAGFSYERINWLHRWIARILFISATTHVVIMKSSISTLDILLSGEKSITVVRYGIGAYSTLLWIVISSILPIRRWNYRFFYLSHLTSSITFLVVLFQHIPTYARTPIYLAIGFLSIDKCLAVYCFIRTNFSIMPSDHQLAKFGRGSRGGKLVAGYAVQLRAPPASISCLPSQDKESTTVLRITNVPMTWRPGQHVRIYIPSLDTVSYHPFTPANISALPPPPLPPRADLEDHRPNSTPRPISEMLLFVKSHKGFTHRLGDFHKEWLTHPCPNATSTAPAAKSLVAYVDGPYGDAPRWEEYERLVLLATGTGVSFVLAVLDHLEQLCFTGDMNLKTQSVKLIWTVRHIDAQLQAAVEELLDRYTTVLREEGVGVDVEIHTTCAQSPPQIEMALYDPFQHLRRQAQVRRLLARKPPLRIRNPEEIYDEWDREAEIIAKGVKMAESNVTEMFDYGDGYGDGYGDDYNFESDNESEGSQTNTLVNGRESVEEEGDPFADTHTTDEDMDVYGTPDDAYRPLPPPLSLRHSLSEDTKDTKAAACQCAIIQHQRRKLNTRSRRQDFTTYHYGTRPAIPSFLEEALPKTGTERSMVAICGNSSIAHQARRTVARMNWDAGLGRRARRVEVFVEGYN